jgi:hypothetical protein
VSRLSAGRMFLFFECTETPDFRFVKLIVIKNFAHNWREYRIDSGIHDTASENVSEAERNNREISYGREVDSVAYGGFAYWSMRSIPQMPIFLEIHRSLVSQAGPLAKGSRALG